MNTLTNDTHQYLSGFALKYIALACMVLDHIHYFFSFTGKVPLFFSQAGRLAAPLFLFCIIEGFIHTRNRKKYFLRIYLLSVLMGLIQFSFFNVGYCLAIFLFRMAELLLCFADACFIFSAEALRLGNRPEGGGVVRVELPYSNPVQPLRQQAAT